MGQLDSKTTVITGAASGMGRAMALLFAREGANVIVADLRQAEIDVLTDAITKNGGKATGVVCDVSNEKEIKSMIDTAVTRYKTVDVLVNNAGVMDDFIPADQLTNELWDRVLAINLSGPMYASRLVIPLMLRQGGGSIINIASVGGLSGTKAGAAYTASKHGIIGLTRSIGYMYAQKGIRCNAIAPGGVNTNIGKDMKPNEFGYERLSPGFASMPRMGEPDEIAKAALFLASGDSSFVNATVLTADGGWTSA